MSVWPVVIGWNGKNLSERELAVLQEAALEMLRQRLHKEGRMNFDCEQYAGSIICKGDGTFGTFCGVIFHVDFPSEGGEKRYADFLVMQHVIDQGIPNRGKMQIRRWGKKGMPDLEADVLLKEGVKLIKRKQLN